jgi:pimeloyl-ACP methyl ester carboxylesterase
VAQLLYTDPVFWMLKAYLPTLFLWCLGMPKGFQPTPEQWTVIVESEESLFPIRPRKQGTLYDAYVSNPDVQGYPLEELSVPTLLIHAKDDGLAAFQNAARAAQRIPGAELLAIRPRRPHAAWERGPDRPGGGKVPHRQSRRLTGHRFRSWRDPSGCKSARQQPLLL